MSPHGITDHKTKVHEIHGISFDWLDPQPCQISSRSDKNVRDVHHGKILLPGKVGLSSP